MLPGIPASKSTCRTSSKRWPWCDDVSHRRWGERRKHDTGMYRFQAGYHGTIILTGRKAADVGVGISGEEGLQAVNSSDYAIAQVC